MPQPSRRTISTARQYFFEAGTNPRGLVGETILASWRRCRAMGLAPGQHPTHVEPPEQPSLRELRDRNEALIRLCRPELELLYSDARTCDSIVILAAPDSTIVEASGSTDFLDKAARVALRPGVSWSEDIIGTNAIGTALHERRPVEVRGAEHYFGEHRVLSCSASPILDGRGQVIGLLDISGESSVHHAHALGIVQLAVGQIERRLLEREAAGRDVIRLHHDLALLDTPREGILVFEDQRLVAANRHAIQMLGLDWSELGRRRYNDLFESARPPHNLVVPLRGPGGEIFQARRQASDGARIVVPGTLPPRKPAMAASTSFFDAVQEAQLARAVRLLDADIPLLLQGETGTGKEVWARELHRRSQRAGGAFVAINCAALPENLIEAELFGYQAGAFTGARRNGAPGLLREAGGGVLFLDEIGDMPLSLQSRLLRVLQEREVMPLGGGRAVKVDFAVIAATLRPLDAEVSAGRFRADLYYRIAQSSIALPPLRERDDRTALVAWIWQQLGAEAAHITLAPGALAQLSAYPWPGNIRQLFGTLKSLLALAEPGTAVTPDELPEFLRRPLPGDFAPAPVSPQEVPRLDTIAQETMQAALYTCRGNVSEAARRLGVSRSTLYRRLRL